jgi:type II secretory pathway component GspD/PulD (secretin)
VTQLEDRASADLDGPRRISLTISRPMELRELLLLLVNGTPLSIVTDDDVSGAFVGDLKDLSMRQALEAVLFPRGLDYDVQGTLVRVFARKASTRLFDVNRVNVRRTSQRDVRSRASGETDAGSAADLSVRIDSDPLAELSQGVQALLSGTGRMHLDRAAGIVQVTDFSDRLDQVGIYIEAVQLRASRQVRVEARVLEVALPDSPAASIDWKAAMARTTGAPAGADALQKALAEQGTITMIGVQRVVAMNNEPAVIRVDTQPITLMLTVTAQIAADGIVQLNVSPTFASRRSPLKSADGVAPPVLRVGEADTMARVRDGETIVLSGPFDNRSEFVILLTPTVVAPAPPVGAGTGQKE